MTKPIYLGEYLENRAAPELKTQALEETGTDMFSSLRLTFDLMAIQDGKLERERNVVGGSEYGFSTSRDSLIHVDGLAGYLAYLG